MREIEFRAWNKEAKVMADMPDDFEEFSFLDEVGYRVASDCDIGSAIFDKNIEVMQFTGLTDIHGVEIYEGDILNHLNPCGWSPMPVIFHDGAFMVAPPKNFRLRFLVQLTSSYVKENELVSVGNIHENPELLEN